MVDGQTGQSIPQFSLLLGAVWNPDSRFLWQRGWGTDRHATKRPGSFEFALGQPAHQYLMRVSAEGYLPEDSGLFLADHRIHEFTFRLTKAERLRTVHPRRAWVQGGGLSRNRENPSRRCELQFGSPRNAENAVPFLRRTCGDRS